MIDLWTYQVDGIEGIEAAAERRLLYVLPTGGGKTLVASRIIARAAEAGKRVLVITHRREIFKQTSRGMPLEHGLIQAGLNIDLSYAIQIASVQTLHCWRRPLRRN
jgi:DNA repair protein RadD